MASRPNLVLALVVGGALVVAVVAAVVASGRSEVDLEPGTPQATVQAYLRAVLDGDVAALDSLEPETECQAGDITGAFIPESARVVLTEAEIDGAQATVQVEVTESSSGSPFGVDEFTHEETFALERSGSGEWRIVGAPWPLYSCEGRVP
jgi:hypothetical protein